MKKWIDAGHIKMVNDFEDNKLKEIDEIMREKPNFNKKEGVRKCKRIEYKRKEKK